MQEPISEGKNHKRSNQLMAIASSSSSRGSIINVNNALSKRLYQYKIKNSNQIAAMATANF